MATKYILAGLAMAFLLMSTWRRLQGQRTHPQQRTWLLIAALLGAVSAWLFYLG